MTLTLTGIADRGGWQSESGDAAPSNPEAWLAWPVTLASGDGETHTLLLPHTEGDPPPTWQDVADHLAALPEEHALAGARLARWLTQRQYLALITDEELLDITDASEGRGGFQRDQRMVARRAVEMTRSGDDIDLSDPETRYLVTMLERRGLLASGRSGEILSGTRPEEA